MNEDPQGPEAIAVIGMAGRFPGARSPDEFWENLIAGKDGVEPVKPLFDGLFRGVLCLFLLDMGLIAARRITQSRKLTLFHHDNMRGPVNLLE